MDNDNTLRYLSLQAFCWWILQYLPLHVAGDRSLVVVRSGKCGATVECLGALCVEDVLDFIAVQYIDQK